MSLSSVLHRLGQVERDLRHELTPAVPGEQLRCDYSYATDAELDRLWDLFAEAGVDHGHELVEPQRSEVESIVAAINERAEREPDWAPPVKRELVQVTRDARAEGRTILPVADDLTVELAFLLHGETPEPEPEPVAETAPPAPVPVIEEPAPNVAVVPPPAPRELRAGELAPAVFTWRSAALRPPEGSAAEILEMEF